MIEYDPESLGECVGLTAVQATPAELQRALERTREAYKVIRLVPAPKRGEILRQIREALAAKV